MGAVQLMPPDVKIGMLPFTGARLELLARQMLIDVATNTSVSKRKYNAAGLKQPVDKITRKDSRFWDDIDQHPYKQLLFPHIAAFAADYIGTTPDALTPDTTRAVPVIYEKGKGLDWHTHDSAQIVTSVTLMGAGWVHFRDGSEVPTTPGMMMAIGRYTEHMVPVYEGTQDYRVVIATNFLDERDMKDRVSLNS